MSSTTAEAGMSDSLAKLADIDEVVANAVSTVIQNHANHILRQI